MPQLASDTSSTTHKCHKMHVTTLHSNFSGGLRSSHFKTFLAKIVQEKWVCHTTYWAWHTTGPSGHLTSGPNTGVNIPDLPGSYKLPQFASGTLKPVSSMGL